MPTSEKKIRANRENGGKSPGPTDTSKSRFSARKHGLAGLASTGLTEIDDAAAYRTIVRELKREKNPVGILEIELVEAAAFDMVGWRRARVLEAGYITAALNPPVHEKDAFRDLDSQFNGATLDPGIPAALGAGHVQQLVAVFQRYESSFSNRLFRTLHELERLQRTRLGEHLPAPAAVDFTFLAETGGGVFEAAATVDVPEGETLVPDSARAELEPEKVLPTNGTVAANVDAAVGKIPPADSSQVAWTPRAPSGPIWSKR